MTRFRDLHVPGRPLVMPNPWDAGSARLMEAMGFAALASTSAGAAYSVGLPEGSLNIDGLIDAAMVVKQVVELPVNADLENGGDTPDEAATTIARAGAAGLDGASIEDYTGDPANPIYPFEMSVERIEAAVEAAKPTGIVLTARAEALQYPNADLNDVLRRISAFAKAGADVVYAPLLKDADQVRAMVKAAGDTPVNVLVGATSPGLSVRELADLGVARISLGSGAARAAYGAMLEICRTALETGEIRYPETTASFETLDSLLALD